MKIENFIGVDGEVITITQPTDIYPLLDWAHSQMMELEENAKGTANKAKCQKAYQFLEKLMKQAEEEGFGDHEDVDNIEY